MKLLDAPNIFAKLESHLIRPESCSSDIGRQVDQAVNVLELDIFTQKHLNGVLASRGLEPILADFCEYGYHKSPMNNSLANNLGYVFAQCVLSLLSRTSSLSSAPTSLVRAFMKEYGRLSYGYDMLFNSPGGGANICRFAQPDLLTAERDGEPLLEGLLGHVADMVVACREGHVRFVDWPLFTGITPLIQACKEWQPHRILLLLRHGADTSATWLGFQNPIMALLLTPHEVYLKKDVFTEQKLKLCIRYYSRATSRIRVQEIKEKLAEGFQEKLDGWEKFVPENRYKKPTELKHLCRCSIRTSLQGNRNLPSGIDELPLPGLLKEYIDLQID